MTSFWFHFIFIGLAQRTSSNSIDFSSLTSQSSNTLVQAQQTSIQSQFSSTPGLDEDLFGSQNLGLMSGMSSPGSASITTVSTSPGDQHDITPSDNEEYKPTKYVFLNYEHFPSRDKKFHF